MATERPRKNQNAPPEAEAAPAAEPIPSEAFVQMHSDPRFQQLKRTLYVFIFPMTAAFLAWYALYVALSGFARDFMAIEIVGGVNMALLLGLLQFVTTFTIAILYSRYARKKFDPLSYELRDEIMNSNGNKEESK